MDRDAAMPLRFLERFPWPSLQTYTALSVVLLAGSIFSAYTTVTTEPGSGALDTDDAAAAPPDSEVDLEHLSSQDLTNTEVARTVLWYLVTDTLFVWVLNFTLFTNYYNTIQIIFNMQIWLQH